MLLIVVRTDFSLVSYLSTVINGEVPSSKSRHSHDSTEYTKYGILLQSHRIPSRAAGKVSSEFENALHNFCNKFGTPVNTCHGV